MSEWLKESKKVKETKAVLIYGPYPKEEPKGVYKISFPDESEREESWVNSFDELMEALKKEIGDE